MELEKSIAQVVADFNATPLKLASAEDYTTAGNLLTKVSTVLKAIDDHYEDDKKATYAVYKAILDEIKATKEPIELMKLKIKRAMDFWNAEQKKAASALRLAQLAAEQEGNPLPVAPEVEMTPKVAGVKTYRVTKWRIIDLDKVPREYLILDEKKVNQTVREMKTLASIPGIEVYEEEEVRA